MGNKSDLPDDRRIRGRNADNPSRDDALYQGLSDPTIRIDEPEAGLDELTQQIGVGNTQGDKTGESTIHHPSPQRNGEVDQLRFQISNLARQLARTEEQVRKLQGIPVRRRSRSGHRMWRLRRGWMRFLSGVRVK